MVSVRASVCLSVPCFSQLNRTRGAYWPSLTRGQQATRPGYISVQVLGERTYVLASPQLDRCNVWPGFVSRCLFACLFVSGISKNIGSFSWKLRKETGKETKSIYIAPFILRVISKRSDMAHTVLLANACLSFVSVHQMAPPITEVADIQLQHCSFVDPKGERLSWPGWLTYSGQFTQINGHPPATGRAQDRESSPVKDRRSTAVPHNQKEVD